MYFLCYLAGSNGAQAAQLRHRLHRLTVPEVAVLPYLTLPQTHSGWLGGWVHRRRRGGAAASGEERGALGALLRRPTRPPPTPTSLPPTSPAPAQGEGEGEGEGESEGEGEGEGGGPRLLASHEPSSSTGSSSSRG